MDNCPMCRAKDEDLARMRENILTLRTDYKSKGYELHKLGDKLKTIFEMTTVYGKVKTMCLTSGMQQCHVCDDIGCGDNTNPLVKRIKKLVGDSDRIERIKELSKRINGRVTAEFWHDKWTVQCLFLGIDVGWDEDFDIAFATLEKSLEENKHIWEGK